MRNKINCGCEKDVFACAAHAHSKPAHTPTPWSLGIGRSRQVYAADGVMVADCETENARHVDEDRNHAAFIVRAVNCHEELLTTLKEIVDITVSDKVTVDNIFEIQEMAETAIVKAKGK